MKEEKPRVTITAELFEELMQAKAERDELTRHGIDLANKALELVARYDRRREAALRLVGMHKAKSERQIEALSEKCDALIEKCNGLRSHEFESVKSLMQDIHKLKAERDEARRLAGDYWHKYRYQTTRAGRVRMAKPLPWRVRLSTSDHEGRAK